MLPTTKGWSFRDRHLYAKKRGDPERRIRDFLEDQPDGAPRPKDRDSGHRSLGAAGLGRAPNRLRTVNA